MGLRIGFDLLDLTTGSVIFRSFHDDLEHTMKKATKGNYIMNVTIPANFLKNGLFAIKLAIGIHNERWIVFDDNLMLKFKVINVDGLNSAYTDSRPGIIMPQLKWTNIEN